LGRFTNEEEIGFAIQLINDILSKLYNEVKENSAITI
jgi:hypothetical protein